ncbi:MAG TPA: hypothetical protein DD726_04320 [Phycisphaerales bacterium]|nr:hypothetical protein [Phycisphaerales bacterium]
MYDASHGRLPPWGVHPDTGGFDPALQWYAAILPYLTAKAKEVGVTSADIYVCPTRKAKYKNVGVSIAGKVAAIEHVDYGVNYGVNVGMFNTVLPSNGSVDPRWMVPPPGGYLGVQSVKISDIRVPSQVFTMMDARVLTYAEGAGPWAGTSIILPEIDAPWAPGSRNSDKSLFTLDYDADEDGLNDSSSVLIMPARYEPPGGIYNNSDHERHGKGPNVLFSDGSVKHVTTKDWLQKCHWLW